MLSTVVSGRVGSSSGVVVFFCSPGDTASTCVVSLDEGHSPTDVILMSGKELTSLFTIYAFTLSVDPSELKDTRNRADATHVAETVNAAIVDVTI